MHEAVSIGTLTAFAAGVVSFLSPCVLPLVPAYLSYVAGNAVDTNYQQKAIARLSAGFLSALFVLGFSVVFILLGAGVTALGRLLLQYRYEAGIAGGIIVTVFGLFMLGGTKWLTFLQRDWRFHAEAPAGRPLSAFVLGIAFAFGWTPCIGPVLGAILTVSAVQSEMSTGIGLLAAYSLGLGVPFLLTAIFLRELVGKLKELRRLGRALQVASGGVLVAMGIAMMTGQLTALSYWLLEKFPLLGKIG